MNIRKYNFVNRKDVELYTIDQNAIKFKDIESL